MYFNKAENKILFKEIGKSSQDLFSSLPKEVVAPTSQRLETPLCEKLAKKEFWQREQNNNNMPAFCGYGLYQHFIPESVSHLSSLRGFVTSYTPYQAEVAQGTLQALFEYQSLMAKLTDMDIANASLYEAGTAMVEAIRMALRQQTNKTKAQVVVSQGIHPDFIKVLHTYFPAAIQDYLDIEFAEAPLDLQTGETQWQNLPLKNPIVFVYQNPNVYGIIENNAKQLRKLYPQAQILYGSTDALSFTVLPSPKEYKADIVWGEAQSLGIPINMGGPSLGFLASHKNYIRQMPGRLIGQTSAVDPQGNPTSAYLITLATREQHIRREKATSNICSNQSLMAVRAAVFMNAMGWTGMQNLALKSADNLHYFKEAIQKSPKAKLTFEQAENFHELAWQHQDPLFYERCLKKGIVAGVKMPQDTILSYFSDLTAKEEIDALIKEVNL